MLHVTGGEYDITRVGFGFAIASNPVLRGLSGNFRGAIVFKAGSVSTETMHSLCTVLDDKENSGNGLFCSVNPADVRKVAV